MKNVFVLLFATIILASCTNFRTTFYAEKERKSLDGVDEQVYLYYEGIQTVPESAVYVGEFKTEFYTSGAGSPSRDELKNSLAGEALYNGANLLMIEKDLSFGPSNYLKGKAYYYKTTFKTDYTEAKLKSIWKQRTPDKVEGIYSICLENIDRNFKGYQVKYGVVKTEGDNYLMVYLNGFNELNCFWGIDRLEDKWKEGDIAAYISKSDKPGLFEIKLVDYNKYLNRPSMAKLDNGYLRVVSLNSKPNFYRKIYPENVKEEELLSYLTGFAIGEGRIVTCYHGVNEREPNKVIFVKGIDGDFETRRPATLEYYDKDNDLAVIKLEDPKVVKEIAPLCLDETNKSAGEDVFILGYPLSTVMGEEIKVTDGVISSTSGYGGLTNEYQISAPMHPGNSGSPVFDKNGNLIGVNNARVGRTETIGYAIKIALLKNLFAKNGISCKSPAPDYYKSLTLPEKINKLQKSVFIIEVIDTKPEKEEEDFRYQYISPWDYLNFD